MTSEQSPHNGNAAGPPEPLTQEGNGLSGRVKGSAARFDWRESFKHLLFAVVCGVAGGFGSILLCLFVDAMRSVFVRNTWLIWLLPVAGLLELLLYKMFRIPLGETTESVIARMRHGRTVRGLLAPGIFLTTGMSILAGGSVGKEAGALQMGASLGATIAKPFKLHDVLRVQEGAAEDRSMHSYAASMGMAATFSALFFAPLGSCMLVLEFMRFSELRYVASMLIGCFVAYFIARHFGIGDLICTVPIPEFTWRAVGICLVIGVACAVVGSIFALCIRLLQNTTMQIVRNYYLWVVVGGLIMAMLVSVFGWWRLTGSGGEMLNHMLAQPNVSWDFAIKGLLTFICLGFWFKGGEIMPSLCIGGLLGGACFAMTGSSPQMGVAVGALCFLAAFNRCPVSAFLLGCEIFGWGMAPFLAVGVAVSFMFGYPAGMYGASIDLLMTSGWRKFVLRQHRRAMENAANHDPDLFDYVLSATTAFKKATDRTRVFADPWIAEHQREHEEHMQERMEREEKRRADVRRAQRAPAKPHHPEAPTRPAQSANANGTQEREPKTK
ncbi:chloride channel protein [Bifidobacterium animalis]|uniref:Voltage gated chloride channel family protein n=1 Tax=Bifidobacterium animalis subsp. lactis TaxID=302911 RepID=A0A8B3RGX3_BIFAN|nr:chloride channel protein [Bifidobacterium animalis]RYM93015.1 voltage gated chloride channel family protein [Bifidobacterium animalis subsp. lactis]